MGCGCGGSKYVAPERPATRQQEIVTDPNDPANFWNGPAPREEPVPVPQKV